ncbi:MAG: MASE1 domain-containing protein [Bacteroidota bacterium]
MNLTQALKFKIKNVDLDFKIILVAVLYYVSARIGFSYLSFEDTSTTAIWPPSGIAFALMLLMGRRIWPGIAIGALITNTYGYFMAGQGQNISNVILTSTMTAGAISLEILIGFALYNKLIKSESAFSNANDTFRFLFIALFMSFVGSAVGSATIIFTEIIPNANFAEVWFTWCMGDAVGILLFTPLILAWTKPYQLEVTNKLWLEIAAFIICLLGIVSLLKVDFLSITIERSFPFLITPFILWLAFRFNLQTAISSVFLVSVFAIYLTINNFGPFVSDTAAIDNDSLFMIQIFVGVVSITTIILSSTVYERKVAQKEITRFNETLEAKIEDRTKELNEEIQVRKKAEEKLKVSNAKLRKANVELDSFVYSVSHDLRAPIASVLGLLNLAKKENDEGMIRKYLDMLGKSAEQQDNFIKEILDLSRNSRLGLEKKEINFRDIVDEIFEQLRYSVSDSDTIERKIEINQEKPFMGDQRRLKVIFNNLISNSIRYRNGKDPIIEVKVDISQKAAKIKVKDNGMGIDKEHLPNVFNMFYRATDKNAGSGLGLYIVKETVEKLNGNIQLESDTETGTTVNLEIPELA